MRHRVLLAAGAGAAAPAWSPLSLSPTAWYDAADAATITASGGLVSTWADKSGNGYDLTAAGSFRPTIGTDSIAFTPSNYLENVAFTALNGTNTVSLYAVLSISSSTSGYGRVVSVAGADDIDYAYSSTAILLSRNVPGAALFMYKAYAASADSAFIYGQTMIACAIWNGGTQTIYVDGTAGTAASLSSGNLSVNHLRINKPTFTAPNDGLDAVWRELVLFPTAHGTTDRQAMETYLRTKWGTP